MFFFELTFDPFVWRIHVDDFDGYFITNPDLLASYDFIWRFKNGLSISGVIFLLYQLEKRILEKKTKYLLTLIQIITVVPALLFGVSSKDAITWIKILLYFGNAWSISIFFIYLYYAGKTTGETRKRAIGAAIGMLFIFGAIVANSSFGKTHYDYTYGIEGLYFTYYLFAILASSGILIYMKSIKYRE
jgi:cell division protein FtsW (lipid II flippase)